MIRKTLFLLAAFSLAGVSAHAQLGVYATVTVDRIGVTPFQTYSINGATTKNSVDPVGASFGAYYDFKTVGPVRLGVDLRGNDLTTKDQGIPFSQGSGTRLYSVLGGVRGSFHTPVSFLKPYVQGSAGVGREAQGSIRSGFEYHGFAGLDVRLLPYLDFRAIELGIGGLNLSGGTGNSSLRSLSSGLVFRFQ